jgi:hypothetical protein
MEEIENFDEWLKNLIIPEIEYYAIFDIHTGAVTGIYPSHSAQSIENKILIDRDLAESVFNGTIPLNVCFVEETNGNLELIQTQVIKKIDDILHRVIDKEYAKFKDPDLIIQYDILNKKIIFLLDNKIKSKKIKWDGNTEVKFILSEYNDPYKFFQVISFKLEDLYDNNLEFMYTGTCNNFSIFTSRIFKKNVIERL